MRGYTDIILHSRGYARLSELPAIVKIGQQQAGIVFALAWPARVTPYGIATDGAMRRLSKLSWLSM